MQFTALALLGMATAATCTAIPEIFERSPLCVRGPKHAGNECDPSNWNSKTCGPGNDGNILLCVKNKANDKYHWEVDVHCKPSKSGSGGGCKNCACRLGPA